MDNTRLLLVIALAFVSLLLWQAWQRDYGRRPAASPEAPAPTATAPHAEVPPAAPPADDAPASALPGQAEAHAPTVVAVRTDVFDAEIDLRGGSLRRVALPDYPISVKRPEEPLVLLDSSEDLYFVLQGGLLGDVEGLDHHAQFRAAAERYALAPDAERLEVRLQAAIDGLALDKVFVFTRGSHAVEIRYEVHNHGATPRVLRAYTQLQRSPPQKSRGPVYTFTGAAFSSPENRYQKFDFDDLREEPLDRVTRRGWVAMIQHYFVVALVPPPDLESGYYSKVLGGDRYLVGLYTPARSVAPGATESYSVTAYIGPKDQDVLAALAPGLDLTVDYGVLWFIAKPLFLILRFIHDLTGNWGWAIILLTVLVKALFFYPSAIGYRSMAKMRRVTPRLQAIRERYADDRARMQQAMMDLYKQERINPLSGCLPILIQIPVFIALYWVLLESVELRQAPFVLWLRDLSTPDPYFALPVLMGVTMYLQQKLNPAPLDPVQQRVMQILPLVFTVMFAWFPSGLVLYWTVSNVLSILQQWVITRRIERGAQA